MNPTIEKQLHIALSLHKKGNINEAQCEYQTILKENPKIADAWNLLGMISLNGGLVDLAGRQIQNALDIEPKSALFLNSMGRVYLKKRLHENALSHLEQAIKVYPRFVEAHVNLGKTYRALGDLEKSLSFLNQALQLSAHDPEALINLGNVCKDKGNFDQALSWYQKSLKYTTTPHAVKCNMGTIHLLRKNFQTGWTCFESRLNAEMQERVKIPTHASPLWQGEDIINKTLLVLHEQGLGDTIQFMRYLPKLAQNGIRILFKPQTPLFSLLKGLDLPFQVLAPEHDINTVQCDFHVPLMSVIRHIDPSLSAIPAAQGYLKANPIIFKFPPIKNGSPRQKQKESKYLKIGIVWQGNPRHGNDRNRSIPLSFFSRLHGLPNIQLYSLQYKHGLTDLKSTPMDIIDLGSTLDSLEETIAAMASLDLIISVDTLAAHLAGALGKPVWLLLPFIPDWRWFLDDEKTPWYRSMHLYRQKEPGNWKDVFDRVRKGLKELGEG